jgi:DNA-binding HxlR family transcriptional regulator
MFAEHIGVPVRVDERAACPATDQLRRAGDRWSLVVLALLDQRPYRFNELRRSIEGLSHRMLALTLRSLERDGLISRTVFPTVPPGVRYALTELGREYLEPLMRLGAWAREREADIRAARERYDARVPTGREPGGTPASEV